MSIIILYIIIEEHSREDTLNILDTFTLKEKVAQIKCIYFSSYVA